MFNATPRGLIRDTTVGGNYSLLGHFGFSFSTSFNFHCATPRGLIRDTTVGGNYSLLGHFGFSFSTSFNFHCATQGGSFVTPPLAAITHFWGILFGFSSNFQCATPRGLIRLGHRWLQLLTFGAFWIQFQNFYCASPRRLIQVYSPLAAITHFWGILFGFSFKIFIVLPQGGLFVYSPLAAITHFWGILDSVQNFQCATPRGLIRDTTVGGNYSLLGHFEFSLKFSMCYPKGAHSRHHRWGQLLTFGAFWIQFQMFNVLPQGGSFVTPPLGAITHFWGILDLVSAPVSIFNVLPQGGSFAYSTVRGQLLTFWAFSNAVSKFSMSYP